MSAKSSTTILHFQLLGRPGDLTLSLDDAPQRRLVPAGLLFLRVHPKVLLDVLLDGDPAVVDVYTGAEDVYFLKNTARLLQNHADQRHSLARFGSITGSEGCLLLYSVVGNSLIFPICPFALLPKFEAGKPGGETGRDAVFTASLP